MVGCDGFDTSSVTCTDIPAALVIRLDFFSLEPKGYALFAGDGEPVTVVEAAASVGPPRMVLEGSVQDGDITRPPLFVSSLRQRYAIPTM
jgi:hypothetical protein